MVCSSGMVLPSAHAAANAASPRRLRYIPPFSIDQPLQHERLRDVLEAKGYRVTYEEINGFSDPLNWRSTLPNGLMALAGPPKPSP
jgi:hypothetical protein